MFFGYNPSRSTGRRSRMFSRPEPGTQASIQPIGNPVPVNDPKEIERARIERLVKLSEAENRGNLERLKADGEAAKFQALLNANNINPEVFDKSRKQSQANKMRQAYSSFLSGLG